MIEPILAGMYMRGWRDAVMGAPVMVPVDVTTAEQIKYLQGYEKGQEAVIEALRDATDRATP